MNSGPSSLKKRVAYLHHGLLMNSEVWVALTDAQRCLPFELVERGFDVWVGFRIPSLAARLTDCVVWQQPRKQVFEKVHQLLTHIGQVLGFLHRRVCLS